MRKKYYTYMVALCSLLVIAGCDKEAVDVPDMGDKVPITLSASSLPVLVDEQTRAETINNKTIGVVAVTTDNSTPLESVDWSGYYLDHVMAKGTNTDLNSGKEVAFVQPQWWPFNSTEYLAFVAYSPFSGAGGDSRVERVAGTNTLKVSANANNAFPDFLYTVPVGPYNKESAQQITPDEAISLGEFQHAMAKLVVRIQLIDREGNPIDANEFPNPNPLKIDELKVWTKIDNGSFKLTQASWDLDAAIEDAKLVCTHVGAPISLPVTPVDYTCFLLPGTEDESYVSLKVSDGVGEAVLSLKAISGFNEGPGAGGVKLEMGKTTLLTIKVMYVSIPDPTPEIILEGQLVAWDYKGESEVIIE